MESRKIQRLEFISDKIEGVDCKREVMCFRFNQSMKKMCLCEEAMAGVEVALMVTWQACERGERGKEERDRGARLGGMGVAARGRGC
jgi:hypothetical protein